MDNLYDLIVIGGGPAGYLGAERAGEAGLDTLLIEKRFIGGVCLNEGCIPSKTFLNSSKIYDKARFSEKYGVETEGVSFNHQQVLQRKNKVVKILVSGVRKTLENNGVDIVEAEAVIKEKNSSGYQVEADGESYTGKRLLIATGSTPITPPLPGLEKGLQDGFVLTNREILDIQEIPDSLAVIGGGIVGLEMSSYFNSVGSEVTVVEMLDHIGGEIETDVSQKLLNTYKKDGVNFTLNSKVVEITENSVIYEKNGSREEVSADKALLAVGRTPVVEGMGLENIGLAVESGKIKVDERGKTNLPGVYAAGDVNGRSMLAHTAYREAEVCVNNMLGQEDTMRYRAVPSVIYSHPEVAWAGETEASAREKNIDYEVSTISMRFSGRYVAENERGNGLCKILVDKKHNKLIGITLLGDYASEIIYGASMMIENEMRVKDIKELIFPHPTNSEIIRKNIFRL